jgi:GT2 family glycosyltransferase
VRPLLLSVIVPTRGRHAVLPGLFEAVAAQTMPIDRVELIVVDDGGPAGAIEDAARPYRSRLPLVTMRQEPLGPGAARNAGAAVARGRSLVFTADDCAPEPDWLARIERRLSVNPGALVGGLTVNALPEDPYATSTTLLIDYLGRSRDSQATGTPFFTPNNLAVPADLFAEVGGFEPALGATGEDRDFCDRWTARGFPMVTAPEAIVRHAHPQTLAGFWRQHVAYGRGSRRFHRRRDARGEARPSSRLTPEPLRFYLDLLLYPRAHCSGAQAWVQSALMVVAQAANLVGFLAEGRGTSRPRTSS